MARLVHLVAVAIGTCLVGCAAFDPYPKVIHTDSSSHGHAWLGKCGEKADSSMTAMEYAEAQACELEYRRDSLVHAQTGVEATLVPLSVLVGYKAARGAPNAGVFAAAGLAGYGTAQVLIQASRFAIYNDGIQQLVCARTVWRSVGNPRTENLQQNYIAGTDDSRRNLDDIDVAIHAVSDDAKSFNGAAAAYVQARLQAASDKTTELRGLRQKIIVEVSRAEQGAGADAGLRSAVERIVSEVQRALDGTIPPLPALSSFGATFDANLPIPKAAAPKAAPPPPPPTLPSKTQNDLAAIQTSLDVVDAELASLLKTARDYTDVLQATDSGDANFAACRLNITQAGYTLPNAPLMLGPGNSMNGKTIKVTKDAQGKVVFTGGQAPYAATMSGAPGGSEAKAIGENGLSYVQITLSSDLASGASAKVTLTDAQAATNPSLGTRTLTVVSVDQ